MRKPNTTTTTTTATPAATPSPLVDQMLADHALRAPNGQGSRHGRHQQARMPQAATVAKLGAAITAAIAAGNVDQYGNVTITPALLIAAGMVGGKTWCSNQHGWAVDQTCTRSAAVHGYVGRAYFTTTDRRCAVLRPMIPVVPTKGTGKGSAAGYKAAMAAHSTAVALQALAASDPAAYLATWQAMLPPNYVARS